MVRRALIALLTATFAAGPAVAADRAADKKNADAPPATSVAVPLARPAATLAGLQIYDGYSTLSGRARGAHEANPLMQWMTASPARFWTVKAATTTASIVVAERLWKHNKAGAIATMAAVNGVAVIVAARNGSVLKQMR